MTTAEPMFDRQEMIMVHDMFRREFGLMPGVVRAVADGDRDRAAVIAGHIGMVTAILHEHHQAEDDLIWPVLVERCAPETAPLVGLMESQHEEVAAIGRAVDEALAGWTAHAGPAAREALAGALDRLVAVLRDHLALEEERVVPLIVKALPAAEWAQMLEKVAGGLPAEQLTLTFGMMMYEGDPEIIDLTVTNMPPEVRPVIKELASGAFAAHSRAVHGTATPPRSTEL
jgi:hypothetical protein